MTPKNEGDTPRFPVQPLTEEQALRELAEIILACYPHRRPLPGGVGMLPCTPASEAPAASES